MIMMATKDIHENLRTAVSHGNAETVKALLSSLNHTDRLTCLKTIGNDGNTLLHTAVSNRDTETLKALLTGLNHTDTMTLLVELVNNNGKTVLQYAMDIGDAKTVKALESILGDSTALPEVHGPVISTQLQEAPPNTFSNSNQKNPVH